MRVAALYDVHGNLPALEAVLSEVDTAHHIVCGGDLVAGPMPVQCLERLRERGATFIRGNTDRAVAGGADGDDGPWAERVRWVREQLNEEQLAFVRSWPHPLSLEVDRLAPVLFCHGSPRSDEEIITAITPPKRLDPMLDGIREEVIVCGHTHEAHHRVFDGISGPGGRGVEYFNSGAWLHRPASFLSIDARGIVAINRCP